MQKRIGDAAEEEEGEGIAQRLKRNAKFLLELNRHESVMQQQQEGGGGHAAVLAVHAHPDIRQTRQTKTAETVSEKSGYIFQPKL